ncbi:MAG: galactose mutarotase [Lachnospiraceae bacterium]|nr:galactose mutarotase [Lachnospiraceae bacterium]
MKCETKPFGKTAAGEQATLFTLKNDNGMSVSVTDFGANVVKICVPDKDGKVADVALGFDDIKGYEDNDNYLGAFVGRFANRIGGAEFTLNGVTYKLEKNDNGNCLHGGFGPYGIKMHEYEFVEDEDSIGIIFSRLSPDMEQGFPGNLDYSVTYTLTNDNEFIIEYFANSDKDTIVNFTNHTYFNLAGEGSGSVYDQLAWIDADSYTPTDAELIPTGEIAPVEGTPLDFRTEKPIGRDINADHIDLKNANGFDQNYALKTKAGDATLVATLRDPKSGRKMEVYTDLPGIQLYAGNFLNATGAKGGRSYKRGEGVCFETQYFPNSCNVKAFPYKPLKADEEFNSITVYKFVNE